MAQEQGMFGPSVEELQRSLMEKQQLSDFNQARLFGQMDLGQQIGTAAYGGGLGITRGLGQLGQAFGVIPEDPRIAEARRLMQIKQEMADANIDPSDIDKFYPEMIRRLNAAGFSEQANRAMQQYTQAQTAQGNLEARRAAAELKAQTDAERIAKMRADAAKAEAEQRAIKGRASVVRRKNPELTEEEALGIAAEPTVYKSFMETPKVNTAITEANGRRVLINKDTGEPIKDLGTAASTAPKITVNTPKELVGNVLALDKALEAPRQVVSDSQRGKDFLNEAAKANNPNAFESARTLLAKAVGEGKLSNADIERVGVTPEIIAGIKDFINKKATGVPTQQMMAQMFALFSIMENRATENITAATERVRAAAIAEGNPQEAIDRAFPLPKQPSGGTTPKATKRWNPATGRIEDIK